METKFQTSFIPKKPLPQVGGASSGTNVPTHHHKHVGGVFFNIAILIFILSLGAALGMYGWKVLAMAQENNLKDQLSKRQEQFNPDLIEELKRVNVQIDTAKSLLANHLALSNVFGLISRMTAERVRFTSLDLTAPTSPGSDITLNMKGYGVALADVAFQSDVFSQLEQYGLRKIVKNPILSDPSLDKTGSVSFSFTASIDPSALLYENSVSNIATSSGQ